MKLLKANNYHEMSKKAAEVILNQLKEKPNSVLGLATGGTVLGTYECLVEDYKKNHTSYQHVQTFNLDEYTGMSRTDSHSYHYYMNENFFKHIDIPTDHIHIPNGLGKDLIGECQNYEDKITEYGGIDLQLLGIGQNGHIGFNEPGTSFDIKTHVVTLTESTRKANARYFESISSVPTQAITMGIGTIRKSKHILLLASGKEKALILQQLFNDVIDEIVPASVLKMHSNVTIIADEEALSLLDDEKVKVLLT